MMPATTMDAEPQAVLFGAERPKCERQATPFRIDRPVPPAVANKEQIPALPAACDDASGASEPFPASAYHSQFRAIHMPVDLSQAVAYVREYGGVIEGARLDRVMYSIPPAEAALTTLAAMQNSDGGFSYWLPHLTVSTVCDTAYVLGWLDDLDVREGPLVQRAIDFVFLHQRDDGGWDEVEGPASLDTPEFLVPGKVSTRVWLTAYCAHRLMRFGCADSPQCRACPVNFLLAHRDKTGRLHGYLRATWDALPVFHAFPDLSGHAFEQALAVTEPEFAPQSWEGSHLAWLGRALRDCDLPADHSLAARCLCALEDRQQRDGRWTSESGEQHAPDATVEVLRVLRDFGLA